MDYLKNFKSYGIRSRFSQARSLLAIDIVLAYIILFTSIVFLGSSMTLGNFGKKIPLILMFSSLTYLFVRSKIVEENFSVLNIPYKYKVVINISLFISLILLQYLDWTNLYTRPPLYFINFILSISLIVVKIFTQEGNKFHTYSTLLCIFCFIFIFYNGIYNEFPGIYGTDPWFHNSWIKETIIQGHVTKGSLLGSNYYTTPMFHLVCGITSLILGISINDSIFASIGFFMAFVCVFSFLLSRLFLDTNKSLLVALAVPFYVYNIERATAIIPMTLGYVFFLLIVFTVLNQFKGKLEKRVILLVLLVSIILTHPISTLAIIIFLIIAYFSYMIFDNTDKYLKNSKTATLTMVTFTVVTTLAQWMRPQPGMRSFFDSTISKLYDSFINDSKFLLTSSSAVADKQEVVSDIAAILFLSGLLILLFFAVIESMFYLNSRNRSSKRMTLTFLTGFLFCTPVLFILLRLYNILPDRWFMFLYVPLSILGVAGLFDTLSAVRAKAIRHLIAIVLLIFVIAVPPIIGPISNSDSPLIFNNGVRDGLTQSELDSLATLARVDAGCPITDNFYGMIIPFSIGFDEWTDMIRREDKIFIQRDYYLIHKEWNKYFTTSMNKGEIFPHSKAKVTILDYMYQQGLPRSNLIYNADHVKAYTLPPTFVFPE